jgi:prepilin-type N-terminal cleavage/methylation domain-containing protein
VRRLLRRAVRAQGGYSLVELVVVMLILGTLLGALTTAMVQGSNAELDSNRRVEAQLQANAAFDRLRRDIHCASSASVSGATMTLSGCGTGSQTWCAVGSGTRYALYRQSGVTCDATGKLYADYLTTTANLFTYTAPVASTSLAKVHVDIVVNANPAKSVDSFELQDDIVLRNSTRA